MRSGLKTYFDTRFGVCMTCVSGVCWPCSDTQPSTILRMDDICHAPMSRNISAMLHGRSILVHQTISLLFINSEPIQYTTTQYEFSQLQL